MLFEPACVDYWKHQGTNLDFTLTIKAGREAGADFPSR